MTLPTSCGRDAKSDGRILSHLRRFCTTWGCNSQYTPWASHAVNESTGDRPRAETRPIYRVSRRMNTVAMKA